MNLRKYARSELVIPYGAMRDGKLRFASVADKDLTKVTQGQRLISALCYMTFLC